jgi:uncharacterized repeat protein (TIGR04138 family)
MNPAVQAMYYLLQQDPRYKFEAYQFVREALAFAQEQMPQCWPEASTVPAPTESSAGDVDDSLRPMVGRHISGQQLCEACRRYGLQQYGYLAGMVLDSWGVRSTGDFGEIVYNLIRIEQMRKSEADRREDFDDVYAFDSAFEPIFESVTSENAS